MAKRESMKGQTTIYKIYI